MDGPILPQHRKKLLDIAIWKLTLAEGHKWKTRFQSQAARMVPKTRGARLVHDHVVPRSKLTEKLIKARSKPADIDAILETVVACTVTKDEHDRLAKFKDSDGWSRYRAAGISVIDTSTGKLLNLDHNDGSAHEAKPRKLRVKAERR
jgi:hypothetical protein